MGYDETPGTQTGSHNLLLDGTGKITSDYASIIDEGQNTDSGFASTTIGGYANKITASYSTLTGGYSNLIGKRHLLRQRRLHHLPPRLLRLRHRWYRQPDQCGELHRLRAPTTSPGGIFASSVTGDKENKATGEEAFVSGGSGGEASSPLASIVGGRLGKAPYRASTILGGLEEVTEKEFGISP